MQERLKQLEKQLKTLEIKAVIDHWSNPQTKLKPVNLTVVDRLIYPDGKSAQGDIIFLAGIGEDYLPSLSQKDTSWLIAKSIGTTTIQATLIRYFNSSSDLQIYLSDVLTSPEKIIGPHTSLLFSFGKLIEDYTQDDWQEMIKKFRFWQSDELEKATAAAEVAALSTAGPMAVMAAGYAASWMAVAGNYELSILGGFTDAAEGAAYEILGHEILAKDQKELFFLPIFKDTRGNRLTINWLKAYSISHNSPS